MHWVVTWFGWFQFQLIKAKLEPGLISRTQTGTGLKTGSGFGLELKPTRTDSGTGTIIFDNKLFLGKKGLEPRVNHQFQTGLPGTDTRMASDFQNNLIPELDLEFLFLLWNWNHSNSFERTRTGGSSWISRSITLIDDHHSSL